MPVTTLLCLVAIVHGPVAVPALVGHLLLVRVLLGRGCVRKESPRRSRGSRSLSRTASRYRSAFRGDLRHRSRSRSKSPYLCADEDRQEEQFSLDFVSV